METPDSPSDAPVISYPPTSHRGLPLGCVVCFLFWWPLCFAYVSFVVALAFWPRSDLAFLKDWAYNIHGMGGISAIVFMGRMAAIAYIPVAVILGWPHLISRTDRPSPARRASILAAVVLVVALFAEICLWP